MRALGLVIGLILLSGSAMGAVGDPIEPTELNPGFGVFGDEENPTLAATKTENGGEVVIVAPGPGRHSSFHLAWDHDGWTEVAFNAELTGIPYRYADVNFEPYGAPGSVKVARNGDTLYRVPPSPHSGWYRFHIRVDLGACEDCVGEFKVNYSLTAADPPLPGDFDFNDEVDFGDFVILANHFGIHSKDDFLAAFPIYHFGDANLDGITDFDDFTILADNFGTSREAELASVPEPGCQVIVFVGALAILAVRRSR